MLLKALARRPDDRFGSAREWRDALLAELGAAQPDDLDRTRVVYAKPVAELDVPATQWPQAFIAQLEQQLAGHVGPVATLLMRRATASATDIDSLHARLATHLPTDAARRDFDVLFSQIYSGPPSARASAVKFAGIQDKMLKDATSRLATYIGPIARVVAKRAAADATDAKTFYARLLVAVPEQKDRDALGREWSIARD
jgi:serine/threonine-protein kinase